MAAWVAPRMLRSKSLPRSKAKPNDPRKSFGRFLTKREFNKACEVNHFNPNCHPGQAPARAPKGAVPLVPQSSLHLMQLGNMCLIEYLARASNSDRALTHSRKPLRLYRSKRLSLRPKGQNKSTSMQKALKVIVFG